MGARVPCAAQSMAWDPQRDDVRVDERTVREFGLRSGDELFG